MKFLKRNRKLNKKELQFLESRQQTRDMLFSWVNVYSYFLRIIDLEMDNYVNSAVRSRLQIDPKQKLKLNLEKKRVEPVKNK